MPFLINKKSCLLAFFLCSFCFTGGALSNDFDKGTYPQIDDYSFLDPCECIWEEKGINGKLEDIVPTRIIVQFYGPGMFDLNTCEPIRNSSHNMAERRFSNKVLREKNALDKSIKNGMMENFFKREIVDVFNNLKSEKRLSSYYKIYLFGADVVPIGYYVSGMRDHLLRIKVSCVKEGNLAKYAISSMVIIPTIRGILVYNIDDSIRTRRGLYFYKANSANATFDEVKSNLLRNFSFWLENEVFYYFFSTGIGRVGCFDGVNILDAERVRRGLPVPEDRFGMNEVCDVE